MTSSAPSIVVGLVVFAWLLVRQARVRVVPERFRLGLPLILGAIGIISIEQFHKTHDLTSKDIVAVGVSLVVAAAGFGALRALTVRIWREEGQIYRQGTWLTIVLWIAAVGLHLLIDTFSSYGSASLLLYLAVSLGVQQAVVQLRANKLRT